MAGSSTKLSAAALSFQGHPADAKATQDPHSLLQASEVSHHWQASQVLYARQPSPQRQAASQRQLISCGQGGSVHALA